MSPISNILVTILACLILNGCIQTRPTVDYPKEWSEAVQINDGCHNLTGSYYNRGNAYYLENKEEIPLSRFFGLGTSGELVTVTGPIDDKIIISVDTDGAKHTKTLEKLSFRHIIFPTADLYVCNKYKDGAVAYGQAEFYKTTDGSLVVWFFDDVPLPFWVLWTRTEYWYLFKPIK